MPVLKNESSGSATKDAIVLDMGDLRRQADQLRQAAQLHAEKIVHQAKQQAGQIADQAREQAYEQGYQDGFAKGATEGREKGHAEALAEHRRQLEQLSETWQREFAQWNAQREAMETEGKQAILRMGAIFGEKVVHRVVDMDPTVVVHQLAESLSYVLKPCNVTIRVNPADRPIIDEAMPQLLHGLSHLERVRVDDDNAVSAGGCIIDFGKGRIDATVDTQLDRLVQTILPSDRNQVSVNEPTGAADFAGPTGLNQTEAPGAESESQ